MNELISIVLPVYNGEKYLRESIDSVLQQTYTKWELLLLDDCSTDNTPVICKEYAQKDNRIVYYRNDKNLRLPGNLNKGFSLAKGTLFTWTSDDNRFHKNALETMCRVLRENEADLVYASYQIMDENGSLGEILEADHNTIQHIPGSNVIGACFLYTRAASVRVGEYDTNLMLVEDFDFWQRMVACCKTVPIDEVLYDYRWHSGSLTSTKKSIEYGRVLEAMLKKNKGLFGKMSFEQKYYYYDCLKKSYLSQEKKNNRDFACMIYPLLGRIRNKARRLRKTMV